MSFCYDKNAFILNNGFFPSGDSAATSWRQRRRIEKGRKVFPLKTLGFQFMKNKGTKMVSLI